MSFFVFNYFFFFEHLLQPRLSLLSIWVPFLLQFLSNYDYLIVLLLINTFDRVIMGLHRNFSLCCKESTNPEPSAYRLVSLKLAEQSGFPSWSCQPAFPRQGELCQVTDTNRTSTRRDRGLLVPPKGVCLSAFKYTCETVQGENALGQIVERFSPKNYFDLK